MRGKGHTLTRNLSVKVFVAIVNVGESQRAQVQHHAALAVVWVIQAQGGVAVAGVKCKLVQHVGNISVSGVTAGEKRVSGASEHDMWDVCCMLRVLTPQMESPRGLARQLQRTGDKMQQQGSCANETPQSTLEIGCYCSQ